MHRFLLFVLLIPTGISSSFALAKGREVKATQTERNQDIQLVLLIKSGHSARKVHVADLVIQGELVRLLAGEREGFRGVKLNE